MLLCPVRKCHQPLSRKERSRVCPQGHSFDIARSGYTNLLQPQERRSKQPGDSVAAVAARRRIHDRGITRPLLQEVADFLGVPHPREIVLDAGCGDGFYLGTLAEESSWQGHGIDISIPAIDAAARRYPACEWIVGNADRFIPYQNESFSLVLSITARMNPPEFRRILRDDGRLLVAIAAPDDLIELRGEGRNLIDRTVSSFAPHFTLASQRRVANKAVLEPDALEDLLLATYRPRTAPPRQPMQVTFSLDLLHFQPITTLD